MKAVKNKNSIKINYTEDTIKIIELENKLLNIEKLLYNTIKQIEELKSCQT